MSGDLVSDGQPGASTREGQVWRRGEERWSNDTVFYDKTEILSDLYSAARDNKNSIKYDTEITNKKRTRTKSESRGISEENSPTRSNVDNEKIVNLLKGNRRPLEVDAREFRVLKEKLLREQQLPPGNLKRETKKFKSDQQDSVNNRPKNVECELKFSDKINGRDHQSVDDEVFWKESGATSQASGAASHKEIVLNPPGARDNDDIRTSKSSRKSRREHFEIEVTDYTHKPFSESEVNDASKQSRKQSENKSLLEKHVSSKEVETKQRETLPHHYTREEKEWLKEKLLEEFERQEKISSKDDCLTKEDSRGGGGKENPINLMMSSSGEGHRHKPSSVMSSHKPSSTANGIKCEQIRRSDIKSNLLLLQATITVTRVWGSRMISSSLLPARVEPMMRVQTERAEGRGNRTPAWPRVEELSSTDSTVRQVYETALSWKLCSLC